MKRILLLTVLATLVLFSSAARAAVKDKHGDRRVRVELKDGQVKEGYVVDKNDIESCQFRFQLSDNPKARKGTEYEASQVRTLTFTTACKSHAANWRWDNVSIYWYRSSLTHWFTEWEMLMPVDYEDDNATVYSLWFYSSGSFSDATEVGHWVRHLVLRPKGSQRGFIVYNCEWQRMEWAKYFKRQFEKEDVALGDYIYNWYHADEKAARKQLDSDPSVLARVYADYLKDSKAKPAVTESDATPELKEAAGAAPVPEIKGETVAVPEKDATDSVPDIKEETVTAPAAQAVKVAEESLKPVLPKEEAIKPETVNAVKEVKTVEEKVERETDKKAEATTNKKGTENTVRTKKNASKGNNGAETTKQKKRKKSSWLFNILTPKEDTGSEE